MLKRQVHKYIVHGQLVNITIVCFYISKGKVCSNDKRINQFPAFYFVYKKNLVVCFDEGKFSIFC